jgi:hypothetical protein
MKNVHPLYGKLKEIRLNLKIISLLLSEKKAFAFKSEPYISLINI